MNTPRLYALAAAVLLCASMPSAASAQAVSSRPEMPVRDIANLLSEQGYRVLEIERDDGRYEVTAVNDVGACVELDVDRRSGRIVRNKSDDDCGSHARPHGRGR